MKEPVKTGGGLSRRRFLKGAGGTVAGSAFLSFPAVTAADEPEEAHVRPGLKRFAASGQEIELQVNGAERRVNITPDTTLLDALREEMDLTGSKEGCDRGACGACTVLLDGKAVNSCMTLAVDAVGREVTTVEGLVKDGRLDAVQQAFAAHDASQCGYCIPGFVVSARALLDEVPQPSREQVRAGLCGNICRCAAYVRIFEAVEAAGKG